METAIKNSLAAVRRNKECKEGEKVKLAPILVHLVIRVCLLLSQKYIVAFASSVTYGEIQGQ